MDTWKKALVFAPHPDDEVIGCGGFLVKFSKKLLFKIVLFSQGEGLMSPLNKSILKKRRLEEFKKVLEFLNIREHEIYNFPDGELFSVKDQIEKLITKEIEEFKPDVVLAPYIFDLHPDHRVVGETIFNLYRSFPNIDFFMYCVYHFVKPNVDIDVTREKNIIKQLFDLYQVSLGNQAEELKQIYVEGIRKLYGMPNGKYLEPIIYINEFNSLNSLISYVLCGDYCTNFSLSIVEKIEQYGALLDRVRDIEKELIKKDKLILDYDSEIYIKDAYIASLLKTIEELEEKISYIKKSIFYKVMIKYRYIVDKYFPEEKLIGRIYRRIIGKIRTWIF